MNRSTREDRQSKPIRKAHLAAGANRANRLQRLAHQLGKAAIGLIAGLSMAFIVQAAQDNGTLPLDLTEMSLEALMNIEVTSVSKKPQKKAEAAAAIFVISNTDLKRWGVTNIPEALRRVPGVQVARIDANKWAITARGFNGRFANKLLVLVDGRSVCIRRYLPASTGKPMKSCSRMSSELKSSVVRGAPCGAPMPSTA